MTGTIFTEEEILQKSPCTAEEFTEYKEKGLITPALNHNGPIPLYEANTLIVLEKIARLKSIGYDTEDIKKIVRKVGLPVQKQISHKTRAAEMLTVGALAEKIGVNPRTVKHWEDKGIIEPDARTEGGFRLYQEIYEYFGKLILDLQMFGYSLDEIKTISDMFRDFIVITQKANAYSSQETMKKLQAMLTATDALYAKMQLYNEGIQRWETLLKTKKKEIQQLRKKSKKTPRSVDPSERHPTNV
jgi:DNA-binding transcriptional MerR regulator